MIFTSIYIIIIVVVVVVVDTYRTVIAWSKAYCLGSVLWDLHWFESSWGRNFLMKFRPVYGTGANSAP